MDKVGRVIDPPLAMWGIRMGMRVGFFCRDDGGAVTVDWIVITGFVVALVLSVASAISPGMETRGNNIVDQVSIKTTF